VMASRCWVADNAFARTQCGRKTTRAIRAVQMSAGDKDRSAEFPNLAKRVFSDPGRSRRRISLSETAIRPLSLCGIRYSNKSSRSEPVSVKM
jgi:hypothetical protein